MKFTRQEQLLLTQLRAVRNQAAGLMDTIDVLLDMAERDDKASPTQDTKRGECRHPIPARESRAAMGHPNRFFCNVCQQDVEE